jgi:hypothetical protein
MGAGASLLHDDDYKQFLTLSTVDQQFWLRSVPPNEMDDLRERTMSIPSIDCIQLLSLIRESVSRGCSLEKNKNPHPSIGLMDEGRLAEKFITSYSKEDENEIFNMKFQEFKGGRFNISEMSAKIRNQDLNVGALQSIETDDPIELLQSMVELQRDHGTRLIQNLVLINIGIDFSLYDLFHALHPTLMSLNLSRNATLHGDLAQLSTCSGLVDLCLEGTRVGGDIASLAPCTRLKKIHLSDLEIEGDIAVFGGFSLKKVSR